MEKETLDKKSINDIEKMVEGLKIESTKTQISMYNTLEYIRQYSRHKENKIYAKSTFWSYLYDRFAIRESTYRSNLIAYKKHSKHSIKYGPGVVTKIKKLCGAENVATVFKKIDDESTRLKKPMSRSKIESIIQGNKRKQITKNIKDWKSMYEVEVVTHDRTKLSLKAAMKRINELEDQLYKVQKVIGVLNTKKGAQNERKKTSKPLMEQPNFDYGIVAEGKKGPANLPSKM